MRILITGGLGWTAQPLVDMADAEGHRVRVLDISDAARGSAEVVAGDVGTPSVTEAAAADVDAIVHLAIAVAAEDYRSPEVPFRTNALGTYNVLQAARQRGAPVVLLSSAPVHLTLEPVQHRWLSSPDDDHLYDLTKRLQEQIASDFAETHGQPVTVLRAGHIVDGRLGTDPKGRPLDELAYCRGGWVCRHDIARACLRSLLIPPEGLRILHVVGDSPGYESYQVRETELALGFHLESRWPRAPR